MAASGGAMLPDSANLAAWVMPDDHYGAAAPSCFLEGGGDGVTGRLTATSCLPLPSSLLLLLLLLSSSSSSSSILLSTNPTTFHSLLPLVVLLFFDSLLPLLLLLLIIITIIISPVIRADSCG